MRNLVYLFVFSATCLYGAKTKDIQVIEDSIKIKIIISTDALQYNDFLLHNPERIVIDLEETSCYLSSHKTINIPPVISIRASQYIRTPSPVTRVVIDLSSQRSFSVTKIPDGVCIDIIRGKLDDVSQPYSEVKEDTITPEKSEVPEVEEKSEEIILKEVAIKKKPSKPQRVTVGSQAPTHIATQRDSLACGKIDYDSRGKRDPFKPWLGEESIESDSLLDVYNATIVGIMWSPQERYALASDFSGKGFILSEGDRVANGRVESITKDEVSFALHGFGGVKRVTLKLLPKEERGDEIRKKENIKRERFR